MGSFMETCHIAGFAPVTRPANTLEKRAAGHGTQPQRAQAVDFLQRRSLKIPLATAVTTPNPYRGTQQTFQVMADHESEISMIFAGFRKSDYQRERPLDGALEGRKKFRSQCTVYHSMIA